MSRCRHRTASYRVCTDSVSQRLLESLRQNLHRPAPTRRRAAARSTARPAAIPPSAARRPHRPCTACRSAAAQAARPSRRHPAARHRPNARPARPAARHRPHAAPPVCSGF
ncbi:hypothetical protein GGX14DRAFT_568280 [Mycena pura]|uniref:Uncharacterized protein n=1 Tax=Mycena pura TaxID=153505 RepID=A0AAD6YAU3_9AGAR|nr:hypothetical protein GGX14DRAFT_568280 [Mycena pura]